MARSPSDKDDSDREKPSWRELDAKRDRSRHLSEDPKPGRPKSFQDKRANSEAKTALNDLFHPKSSKEQEEGWKTVVAAKGVQFSKQASGYVEKFGLPGEWDKLLRLLDHEEPTFVENVLDSMEEKIPAETEMRKELLKGKLSILKLEREEPKLLSKFDEVLHLLAAGTRDNDYS